MRAILITVVIMAAFLSVSRTPPILAQAEIVEVGNKYCPVSGDEISGKHFAVHEGKRYGFCCGQCIKKFEKDPEKYITVLKQALTSEAGESGTHDHAAHGH